MYRFSLSCVLVAIGVFPFVAMAANESERITISPVATLGKLALGLLVVLSVFWVFARVMRRLNGIHSGVQDGLKVVTAISLGQRERIVVVQAGATQLLLGVTANQISALHVLEEPIDNRNDTLPNDFKSKLSAALNKQGS